MRSSARSLAVGLPPLEARPWLVAPLLAVLVVCGIHTANLVLFDEELLSLDQEGSALTLAGSALFGVAGVLALGMALRGGRYRVGWSILGLTGILFGLEEGGLMLHERFETSTSTGIGLILAVLFALALLGLVIRSGGARLPAPAASLLVVAALALVFSQLLGGAATRAGSGTLRDVLAVGEECGELVVAGLMAATVLCVAGRREGEAANSGHE